MSDDPDAWHPLDTLYAPLYSSNGELLGNMAVDLPPGNKVPDQQGRELLEMFVVQAGLALEHAQRREQLSRQVRLGEALKTLAFAVHRDLDERAAGGGAGAVGGAGRATGDGAVLRRQRRRPRSSTPPGSPTPPRAPAGDRRGDPRPA